MHVQLINHGFELVMALKESKCVLNLVVGTFMTNIHYSSPNIYLVMTTSQFLEILLISSLIIEVDLNRRHQPICGVNDRLPDILAEWKETSSTF